MTRIYDTYGEARRAADVVNGLGYTGVEASLVGNEGLQADHAGYENGTEVAASGTATGAGIGAAVGGGAGLLAGLGMLAIPGIGPVVAAGWLAATALGIAGGAVAGGAVGALTDIGISEEDAPVYSEAVRRGGMLVSVRFPDERRAAVENALDGVPSMELEERRNAYEADGWRGQTDDDRRRRMTDLPPLL
jgi:hypothetical protein